MLSENCESQTDINKNQLINININDILEVRNENENIYNNARVLQIKEDTQTNERFYYVHFLNLEKRMDKWVSENLITKNFGNKEKEFDIHLKFNQDLLNDKTMLTRKRSKMIGTFDKENHNESESIDSSIKIKNVEKIILGYYEIDSWYYSPYPQEFTTDKILFICEYCLKYMRKKNTLIKHKMNCKYTSPPGEEIYYQELVIDDSEINKPNSKISDRTTHSISVFQIKGEDHKLYCQNLCLIAKLFLDHKSIYFDVSPFKFYVLTENDKNGKHVVAYFSKESSPYTEFNLACIMVLPPYQRKGYGQFLISMSYYFSKQENRICTPETPLSDLGRISYKSYWTHTLLETLLKFKGNLSVKELSEHTGIKNEDIIYTLNELSLIKYWKGQQVIQTINTKQIEEFLVKKRAGKQHYLKFNPDYFVY